jgi:predicted Zn-dependent protease with MMP-like domain
LTLQLDRESFEHLVAEAIAALPDYFRDKLDNVEIVVEPFADQQTMRIAGVRHPMELLGFYHGVPQTQRTSGYNLVMPDKIILYQRPIEARCNSLADLKAMATHVLEHELAHHFGIDDDRLRQIGAY